MNRRSFLGLLAGGLAASAAVRSFPFRVFSFPKEIVRPQSVIDVFKEFPYETCIAVVAVELEKVRDLVHSQFTCDDSFIERLRAGSRTNYGTEI
jgi:hypothetical protein